MKDTKLDADTFDAWTETDSNDFVPPLEATVDPIEVKAKKVKAPKTPLGKKQKMMAALLAGVAIIVGAAVLMGDDDSPAPPPARSADDVASILAASQSPQAAPFGEFEDVTPTEDVGLPDAQPEDSTLAALNANPDEVAFSPEVYADAIPADIVAQIEAQAVVNDNAAPVSASAEIAPASEKTLQLRIEALEGDLKRAQAAKRSAERNQRVSTTVVAVLDDGVVIRDARGREQVLAVGDQVKL